MKEQMEGMKRRTTLHLDYRWRLGDFGEGYNEYNEWND
jgi:hypothetical protein